MNALIISVFATNENNGYWVTMQLVYYTLITCLLACLSYLIGPKNGR